MKNDRPEELFQLEIVTDNPLFEGFAMDTAPSLLGRGSLDDDICPGFEASEVVREWHPIRLAKVWKPPKVKGRVAPYQDFPGINMVHPAFSRRACDALRDFLEPNGELLSLDSKTGEYYFYNITTVIDALDLAKSKCDFWCDPPTTAVDIDYFAFHEERLVGTSIFRILELPLYTIVTKAFVDRVHESRLNGFSFEKIWPFPSGVNWRLEAKSKRLSTDAQYLKQNTVVIRLGLTGDTPKPSESARFASLEDELDSRLAIRSLESPYFGRYEGHEIAVGEFRMFVSCPDAALLVQELLPILKRLDWNGKIRLMKRYGEMRDANAEEETIEVS